MSGSYSLDTGSLSHATGLLTPAPPGLPGLSLVRRIGKGAYGEVWLATTVTGRPRAVKFIHRASFESERPYEREFAGLQAYEPISRTHPGLAAVLHLGLVAEADCFYYIMEAADPLPDFPGSTEPLAPLTAPMAEDAAGLSHYRPWTLRSELKARGRLPATRCTSLLQALAAALGHLHHHGLMHRDVKPSNIIFFQGQPRLADLGLVTSSQARAESVGTAGYIPERGAGETGADLYALCLMGYELLTGQDRMKFPEMPPDFATWPDRLAALALDRVLLKACDPDPSRRYATAQALAADLAATIAPPSKTRRRVLIAGLSTAAAAAGFAWRAALLPLSQPPLAPEMDNGLTAAQRQQGFKAAWNGHDFTHWRISHFKRVIFSQEIATSGVWATRDGALHILTAQGNLSYVPGLPKDFELTFDWRVPPGGDSGVDYTLQQEGATLREYQCVDDIALRAAEFPDPRGSGSLYGRRGLQGLKQPPTHPPGEWNTARIIVFGRFYGHWLNGQPTVLGTTRLTEPDLTEAEFFRLQQAYTPIRLLHEPRRSLILNNSRLAIGASFRRIYWRPLYDTAAASGGK
jgi:Domain of Unknown Function (DUF1080)/Protein kinase domain